MRGASLHVLLRPALGHTLHSCSDTVADRTCLGHTHDTAVMPQADTDLSRSPPVSTGQSPRLRALPSARSSSQGYCSRATAIPWGVSPDQIQAQSQITQAASETEDARQLSPVPTRQDGEPGPGLPQASFRVGQFLDQASAKLSKTLRLAQCLQARGNSMDTHRWYSSSRRFPHEEWGRQSPRRRTPLARRASQEIPP